MYEIWRVDTQTGMPILLVFKLASQEEAEKRVEWLNEKNTDTSYRYRWFRV